tara:strand:+ start:294 stop:698 length:405 start_codon:yes stop_codon:yes gene_type:complete
MTEQSTVDLINKNYGTMLVLKKDKFSSYDAEDDNYIVEIKNRRSYYSAKIIEANKLFSNYQKSQIKGKIFLYIVTDDKGVYVFNINNNIDAIVKSELNKTNCPINTDFGNKQKIVKYAYNLLESISTKIQIKEC